MVAVKTKVGGVHSPDIIAQITLDATRHMDAA